jgi:hypothetical protein
MNKPYHTSSGTHSDGTCPICPPHANLPGVTLQNVDTAGHILGGCLHPEMKARYISRHNKAILLIHKAIINGTKGNTFMIMDASDKTHLPSGVFDSRIPR